METDLWPTCEFHEGNFFFWLSVRKQNGGSTNLYLAFGLMITTNVSLQLGM
jgi:hypothetical protein